MTRNAPQAATLRDVARLAGVSVNTASLAIRQSARISAETTRRVLQMARRLHYVPNSAARNLARKRSGMIGIYANALYDAVRTRLINCLFSELHTAEYRPLLGLGEGHGEPWHTSPWIRTFQELKVEALVAVVEGAGRLPRWPGGIPTVLVGCQPRESLPCDYLGLDRKDGGRMGIEHLLGRGHRKVLVASPAKADFTIGCFERLKAAGLNGQKIDLESLPSSTWMEAVVDYVTHTPDKPTAAIFGDSPLAARFMHRLEELGWRIPQDLAVISYDYFPWADMLKTSLSTVEQPIEDMAVEAVKMVKARLADPVRPPMQIVLPHRLVVRESA